MVLQKLLRMGEGRRLKQLWKQVEEVNAHEADVAGLSDAELTARTDVFRARIADGEELDELMPEAFATVREAARRVLGQRPYDVQVLGGIVLHDGDIAEMRTGEGKTLTSTMPVYLNALSGKGVHVVTVNPYLASRDAEWMGRVHRFLGLTVGLVYSQQPKAGKREAYACDITYGTNNELGFDYLRDHMVLRKEEKVQRGHAYSIVDEVDSILVDDARTPLIISGPAEQATEWYQVFAKRVSPRLTIDEHYEVDEAKNTVAVTEEGVARVEELLGVGNLYESVNTPLIHHLQNALRAKELYRLDDEYIVEEGEVHIVDENTGRTLYGRRYSEGLHQAIEAKEGVTIKEENQTLATITLQNFFRLYDKLAGMTGTAKTEESEFAHIYNIGVVVVPTNEPIQRNDQADQIYKTGDAKLRAVVHDVVGRYEAGQPVLLGTVSVEKSETLSSLLQRAGVTHEVLNAKNHFREADIVAQAGRQGAVTVATNMAGRGVDIMLGGNPEALADEATRKELDVGSDGEIEDPELFQKTYLEHLERFQGQVKAEGDEIRSLGGLYVCATERHESRRIDNQLRGRSGRQGDPGESRFYLSLEDDLMRLFNASAVESIMNRLKLDDDVPIEAGMVSKAVERAQRQVESRNFEMRKNVLKYDDVMNSQRSVVYAQRTVVLEGRDEEVAEFAEDVVQSTIEQICATYAPEGQYPEDWPLDELFAALSERYDVGLDQEALRARIEAQDMTAQQLAEMALEDALDRYEERETELGSEVMRAVERRVLLSVVDRVWREHLYEMDHLRDGIGLRAVGQRDPLVEYQREAYDEFSAMMVRIREESTGYFFRLPVQRVEPAPEAEAPPAEVVKTAKADKKPEIVRPALRDDPPPQPTSHTAADGPVQPIADAAAGGRTVTEPEQAPAGAGNGASGNGASGGSATDEAARSVGAPGAAASRGIGSAAAAASAAAANEGQVPSTKVGRNDSCPCGSGRKFKKCHGA